MQLHLLPDPQPLVERLGRAFFRELPTGPGVYWLRDAADVVLYVGKARNLRQRLASYRVANAETLPRRRLRLLHLARRIEWQICANEAAALARERELLLTLRPRFNRAGVWPAPARYLVWRRLGDLLELKIAPQVDPGWMGRGPMGAGAEWLRPALVRLLWCGLAPGRGLAEMPAGWFHGQLPECVVLGAGPTTGVTEAVAAALAGLLAAQPEAFVNWLNAALVDSGTAFSRAAVTADLEVVTQYIRPPGLASLA